MLERTGVAIKIQRGLNSGKQRRKRRPQKRDSREKGIRSACPISCGRTNALSKIFPADVPSRS